MAVTEQLDNSDKMEQTGNLDKMDKTGRKGQLDLPVPPDKLDKLDKVIQFLDAVCVSAKDVPY